MSEPIRAVKMLALGLAAIGGNGRSAFAQDSSGRPILITGTVSIADGLAELDVPREYRKRDYQYADCFDRNLGSTAWRAFCVSVVHPGALSRALLRTDSNALPPRCNDCNFYEDIVTDSITLGGRTALRQRALLSGTYFHLRRHRVWRLLVPLSPKVTVVFAVERDERSEGEEELLGIARSLRLRPR